MELFSLQSLFLYLLSIGIYLLVHNHSRSKQPNVYQREEVIRSYPVVGHAVAYLKNRHRFLDWSTDILAADPAHTVTYQMPGLVKGVITANPINLEYMLKTNFENYTKGALFTSLLRDFLGTGIFNADGELWKIQRKTAIYEFNTRSLRNFILDSILQEIHERLLPLLTKAAKKGSIIDLQNILERFAFDNVCKIAFNEDPMCLLPHHYNHNHDQEEEEEEGESQSSSAAAAAANLPPNFAQAFEDAANLSAGRFQYAIPSLWKLKKILNIGSEKRLKESISIVHEFATKIILSRKQKQRSSSTDHHDLLSRFMMNSDEDYSVEFLRDIIISFILAGRDTTSSALAWFFWVLSSRPDVESKILDELRWVRKRNGNWGPSFSFDELRQMHYLHAAVSEALRLFPPVAYDSKECKDDDVLPDGTMVRKGWLVSYHVYAMGRMESIWGSKCREFVPERWLENNGDGCGVFKFRPDSPFKFPAFNAGPRVCIGREMAYMQMKLIVACMLERLEVEAVRKDWTPEQLVSLTLRIKGGLPVHVKERTMHH